MTNNSEFVASLDNATSKIIQDTIKNVKLAVLVIEAEAKRNVPYDLGVLRASITSDVTFDSVSIVGSIFSNLDYAPYVHQGTGIYAKDGNGRMTPWVYCAKAGKYKGWHTTQGQKPQPFLEDAKLKNKNKIERMLAGK